MAAARTVAVPVRKPFRNFRAAHFPDGFGEQAVDGRVEQMGPRLRPMRSARFRRTIPAASRRTVPRSWSKSAKRASVSNASRTVRASASVDRRRFNGFEQLTKLGLVRGHKEQIEDWFAPARAARVCGNESDPLCGRTLHHMARGEIFLKREVQETDISLRLVHQQSGSFFGEREDLRAAVRSALS